MVLTRKQQAALDRVSGQRRQAMQTTFNKQNQQHTNGKGQQNKPQPRPKAAPRQQRAGGPSNLTRMARMLSASHEKPVPGMRHEGKAFPFHGVAASNRTIYGAGNDIQCPALYTYLGFFTNVGQTACCGVDLIWDPTAVAGFPTVNVFNNPALSASSTTVGGATSGRAMKMSLGLCCNTPMLDRGGRVYILNCDQRIRLPGSPFPTVGALANASWNDFAGTVRANSQVKKYDLVDFPREREIISHVVNSTDYETYTEWGGAVTAPNGFMSHIAQWVGGSTTADVQRPMSTIIVLIDCGKSQYFSVTPRAAWYTRHALDTIPGQAMTSVPVAAQNTVNAIHSATGMASDVLHDVESIAAEGKSAFAEVAPYLARARPVPA